MTQSIQTEDAPVVELPILWLGTGWFPDEIGGLERYFRRVLEELEAVADTRAVVYGPAGEAPPTVTVAGDVTQALPRRLVSSYRAVERLAPRSSVLDSHFALYAVLPIVFGTARRLPLVVHFHGPWAEESAAAGASRAKVGAKRAVERLVYGRAREFVVLSNAFKRVLVERYRVAPWRVNVVSPGVDLEFFSPGARQAAREHLALPRDSWVAVVPRRLVPRMGLDVLLDSWALVSRRRNALLVVIGDGSSRRDLEERARRLEIADGVRFVGAVSDSDLAAYYRAADACIVPSVALEGFGLVVLEALATGTPVIVTDVGGMAETVSSLDPSLVVAPGDVEALAERVDGAISGSAGLPDADACRRFAERFSWRRVASHHAEIYDRVRRARASRKLRVVYLDHCAQLSGAELALLRLLPALGDVEPHVILAEDGPLVSRLLRAGISVEVMPMDDRARGLARDRVAWGKAPARAIFESGSYAARLAWRLRRLRPDIVHSNSLKAAVYGGVAGRLAGVPVVWHLRDRIATDYLSPGGARLVRALARVAPSAVVANSHATLHTLAQSFPADRLPPAVIHDPVTLVPKPTERDADELRVGIVGRLTPWKGQDLFLEAFADACGERRASAVIIGAALFGENGYERELREQAAQLHQNGRVEFRGFREDVAGELARLDILVHASLIPEPFGQVVVEGMAAGLPVVAPRAGGPGEVIEHDVTGVLYEPGDTQALASCIRDLADDPGRRDRLGRAATARARDFAPEIIAAELSEMYRALLRNQSR